MKKFGFFLALIAVLTMGTTAFAASNIKTVSWDVLISGDMKLTGTATVDPASFTVSHDAARTYNVALKSGDTFALSGDAKWWAVSADNNVTSVDATISVDTYVKSESVDSLGTYFEIVESSSMDFYPKVSGDIPSFKVMAVSYDTTAEKTFSIILTPNLSEDISGDEAISLDANVSTDMAVTFKFTIAAVTASGDVPPGPDPVTPKPVEPVTTASADAYAEAAGFEVEEINGSAYPIIDESTMAFPPVAPNSSWNRSKSLVFPFVTVTISSEDTGANLQINTSSNDVGTAIPGASFDVADKEAGYHLYKIAPDGKAHKLTKVASPSKEGEFSVDASGNLLVYVKDKTAPNAAGFDFDSAAGVIVDPVYAAYVEPKRTGSSSSGCSAGYAPFALLFAAPLFFFRKK